MNCVHLRWAMAVVLTAGTWAAGQPLAERIPADAMVYVAWAGADSLGAGYEKSHLKAVLDASDFKTLVNDFLPRLMERIGREDRNAREAMDVLSAISGPMWKHPSAFYFGGLDLTDVNNPIPRMAILCDAGAEAPALSAKLGELVAKAGHTPVPLSVRTVGTRVMLVLGDAERLNALGAGDVPQAAATLLKAAPFAQALGQVHAEPVAIAYIDVEAIIKLIDEAVQKGEDRKALREWPLLRDASGINGIQRFIWTGAFDGADWSSRAFIAAPANGGRVGLASLLDGGPLSAELLKAIPADATMAGAGTLDLASLFQQVRTALGKVDPNAQQQFDEGMDQIKQRLGLDLHDDVLAPLGAEWGCYVAPQIAGSGLTGMVGINRLRDPAAAEKGLSQLEQVANNLIAQNMGNEKVTLLVKTTREPSGLKIHYLAIPLIAPAWAIKDGNLYVGLYPQTVSAAAAFTSGKGASIQDNPAFAALRKRLETGAQKGKVAVSGFGFADLPRTAPESYQTLLALSRLMTGVGDLMGAPAPALFPAPLPALMPHLAPAGSITWTDDDGWHMRAISPFPGSELFGGGAAMGPGMAMQAPVMLGILLPSLNRARTTANRVKSASNLRQIGMGCALYANEHRGKYPPDLAELVKTQDLGAMVFVHPDSDKRPPVGAPMAELAPWVMANSDYVYVGAGKTSSSAPDDVLAYERPGINGNDGINTLFADGHVEFVRMDAAMGMIERNGPVGIPAPRGVK